MSWRHYLFGFFGRIGRTQHRPLETGSQSNAAFQKGSAGPNRFGPDPLTSEN